MAEEDNLEQEVITKIAEVLSIDKNIDKKQVNLDSRFEEDLKVDSLTLVELVMALEEKYNLDIPEDKSKNMKTVKDIVNYVKENYKE